ncbi:hypothetical protein KUTeg_009824 [Tegillarca granosa]|uniref:RNF34/RFFL HeH domain-containing protein n=1 Tax=Tegillarca granosa TaxID=220873 RepID=A0ABQ9F794_TEGGR|nr:hypothetical protein KUTeg_009824 [Tegillarca granosa]
MIRGPVSHYRLNQQTTGTPKKRMKIDDVKEIDQIDSLSVQQLKEILVTNFVDYKGCVEKYELMDRVRRLWREHQNNKKKVEEINNLSDNKVLSIKDALPPISP